jgi:hypothetical protein
VAFSSSLHSSGFDQLLDKTIASVLVDRLSHHAHVIVAEGESVRLIDAASGKGGATRELKGRGTWPSLGNPKWPPVGNPAPLTGVGRLEQDAGDLGRHHPELVGRLSTW